MQQCCDHPLVPFVARPDGAKDVSVPQGQHARPSRDAIRRRGVKVDDLIQQHGLPVVEGLMATSRASSSIGRDPLE